MPANRSSPGNGAAIVAVSAIAIAALLYPVIANSIPPLYDYAGHLSRIFVLYNLIHGTGFADMYRVHLAVVPNLAVDGVVLSLMQLGLPVGAAGRCFLALMLLALALGVMALHYANFRRISLWPVLALPFLYQDILFWGFLNYLLGVGLALATTAIWRLNARNLPRAGVILLVCSLVLFFTHLLALLLTFGLVVGVELSLLLRPGNRRTRDAWARLAVAVVAAGAPLVLLFFAPLIAENHAPPLASALRQLNPQLLVDRLKALLWFSWAYDPLLDRISLFTVFGVGAYALIRGLVRFDIPSLLPIAGLLAIYLVVPDGWFHTAYLPDRLPLVLFLLAFAATDVVPARRWERLGLVLIVAVLAVTRGAAVERAWQSADAAFRPLFAAFPAIPEGSRVYYAVAYKGDYSHLLRVPFPQMIGYAAIDRDAFYPETYTDPSQNIVVRQPAYENAPKPPRSYQAGSGPVDDDPYNPARLAFYDYLLVVNVPLWPQPPPPNLSAVLTTPDYTLFRIEHPGHP